MKTRILVPSDQFDDTKHNLCASGIYFIEGHDSIFVPSKKLSYVNENRTREWPDVDGVIEKLTAGEAARTELKRSFPDVRFRRRKTELTLLDKIQPMHYRKPWEGEAVYIDLKGAYWQIYRFLCLDLVHPRGTGSLWLWETAERLKDWKVARNTLVGVIRSHTITGRKGYKVIEQKMYNPHFNPHLWGTIQDFLHELAAEALRRGAMYIATDGYIFPARSAHEHFRATLDRLDLSYHYWAGDASIRGFGRYNLYGYKLTKGSQEKCYGPINNIDRYLHLETIQYWQRERERCLRTL